MDDSEKYDPAKFRREGSQLDKAALLPELNTAYKAAATAYSEVPRLVIVMGQDGFKAGGIAYHTLQYAHIDAGELGFTAEGQVFRYAFYDLQPKLLTVHGRNVLAIFNDIGLRRMPWIRVTDRDFRVVVGDGADEPVITRIELTDWKPKPKPKGQPVPENVLAEEMA